MPFSIHHMRSRRAAKTLKALCGTGIAAGYLSGMAALCLIASASKDMPSGETFYTPNRPVSVQIVDRHGRDLVVRGAAEMRPAKLVRMPAHVPLAVMAVEDRRFYGHTGVDPIGLLRAAYIILKRAALSKAALPCLSSLLKMYSSRLSRR